MIFRAGSDGSVAHIFCQRLCGDASPTHRTRVVSYVDRHIVAMGRPRLDAPSSAVLMDLASHLKKMKVKAIIQWTPRRGQPGGGRTGKRGIPVCPVQSRTGVPSRSPRSSLVASSRSSGQAADDVQEFQASGCDPQGHRQQREGPKDRLRMADPWFSGRSASTDRSRSSCLVWWSTWICVSPRPRERYFSVSFLFLVILVVFLFQVDIVPKLLDLRNTLHT